MSFLQRKGPHFITRHNISAKRIVLYTPIFNPSHTRTAYKFNDKNIFPDLIFSQQRIQQLFMYHCRSNKRVSQSAMTYTVHANVHIRKFVQHMAGGALSILRLRLFPACSYNNVRTVCSVAETISSIAITNLPALTRYMTDCGRLLNVQVTSLLRK